MNEKISIACLPVAGIENPYQFLMIKGLNTDKHIKAFNGIDNRFFGIIQTYWKFKPDYIHFDWITSYYERRKFWMTLVLLPVFYFQVLYIKFFSRAKIVWTLHNILPHNVEHKRLHLLVRHFFGKQCDWIRVFSESSVDRVVKQLKLPRSKFKVIPEGDYCSVYPNSINESDAREKLGIQNSEIVLLWLGFIKPYKGLENLINKFLEIKNDDARLLIAGKSFDQNYLLTLKALLNSKSEHKIRLVDEFIPKEKLQIYFNAADAVVLPFDKIENSGSLIMAMGFKKPVLAPAMGVLKKRLKAQESLLYEDLSEGLLRVLNFGKTALKQLGEQNYDSVKKFKWEDFTSVFK